MAEYAFKVASFRRKIANLGQKIKDCNDVGRLALTDNNKVIAFKGQFRSLEKVFDKFESMVEELTDLCAAADKATEYPDANFIKTMQRYFNEANTTYVAILEKEEKARAAASAAERSSRFSTTAPLGETTLTIANAPSSHLPVISLPEFGGRLLDWPRFKDVFEALIHTDDSVVAVKKFHYLVSALKGPALALVTRLPVTAANYGPAWELLCKQYDNKRLLAVSYLNEVLNFPQMSGKATLENYNSFLSTVSENLSAFKRLEIKDSADFILFHLASRSLDPHTREQMENHFRDKDFPKVDDLSNFIRDKVRTLQLADPASVQGSSSNSKSTGKSSSSAGTQRKTALLANKSSQDSKAEAPTCVVCNEVHALYKCSSFVKASPKQCFDLLKKWKGCRNCLSYHHTAKDCKSSWTCKVCRERHNTLLHMGKPEPSEDSASTNTTSSNPVTPSHAALNAIATEDSDVLLGTAMAEIKDRRGKFQKIRLVVDCGSQCSFVTRRFVRRLGLHIQSAPRAVGAIGRTVFEGARGTVWCTIKPMNQASIELQTSVVVLNEIVCDLPNFQVPENLVKHYTGYSLADPRFWESQPIDFLLGCDLYPEICKDGIISLNPDWPRLFPSVFGYIVAGKLPVPRDSNHLSALSAVTASPTLQDELRKFWELEEPGCTNPTYTREEEQCVAHFRDTHYRTSSGQYVVRLPFKETAPALGDSLTTARRRFYSQEGKLLKDPSLRKQYVKFMQEYCDMDHMAPTTSPSSYLIPHHSVTKEDRGQIKLRVVFDASSKTPLGSLNDHLLIGPKLQKDIASILMNFRRHAVVFTTDVVKMYRFILLDTRDRPYQHILWRFNPADPLQKYELATLTYGLSPAPFLALSVMKQLCEDEGHKYPKAAQTVLRDMYIDDIASGASSLQEALELQRQLIGLLGEGTFRLSKWSSNRQELLDTVAETNDLPIDLSSKDDYTVKILGLQWDPAQDCFSYRIQPPSVISTKRSIASAIAKIYDPLGLVSPVVVAAKILLQGLWKAEKDWGEPIPAALENEWRQFVEQLPSMTTLRIPRFVLMPGESEFMIVGFSDASEMAYSASIYLRVSYGNVVKVHLLIAKSKLAPVKTISIPRLELCGALLLTRTLAAITSFVAELPPGIPDPIFYTDSTVVLGWLSKPSYVLKTFVANRVTKIVERVPASRSRHVRSQDNPSDINSRGLSPNQLEGCSLW